MARSKKVSAKCRNFRAFYAIFSFFARERRRRRPNTETVAAANFRPDAAGDASGPRGRAFPCGAKDGRRFCPETRGLPRPRYSASASSSQSAAEASEGIRQSPRGERATEPTLTPSGRQERLNCCEKKRR